jgi:hypothetical protein
VAARWKEKGFQARENARVLSIRRRRHLIQIEGETAREGEFAIASERTGGRKEGAAACGPAGGVVEWSKERTTGVITAHEDRTVRNTSAVRP